MKGKLFGDSKTKLHPYVFECCELLRLGRCSRREFLRTVTLLGVTTATAYMLAGQLRPGRNAFPRAAEPQHGGTLRCAMPVPDVTDPAQIVSVEQFNLINGVIETLTSIRPDGITRPNLVESWKASDDLKTWFFNVRRGITWSNGDEFTADDVLRNFRRWFSQEVNSPMRALFPGLSSESVEKVDTYTFTLHLDGAADRCPRSHRFHCILYRSQELR